MLIADMLDYPRILQSGTIRELAGVAAMICQKTGERYELLPALFARFSDVNLYGAELTREEVAFIGEGARSSARILHDVGFDENDEFHQTVFQWIYGLNTHHNITVAAESLWALGNLGTPAAAARLEEFVLTPRRADDMYGVSFRGIAFRMLARIDRATAKKYRNSDACLEFLSSLEHYIANLKRIPNWNQVKVMEAEIAWLRA